MSILSISKQALPIAKGLLLAAILPVAAAWGAQGEAAQTAAAVAVSEPECEPDMPEEREQQEGEAEPEGTEAEPGSDLPGEGAAAQEEKGSPGTDRGAGAAAGTALRKSEARPMPRPAASSAKNLPPWAQRVDQQEERKMGAGRWRRYRTHRFDAGLTDTQRETIEQLEAIGYLPGSAKRSGVSGVTVHDRGRAYAGLNFYTSGHAPEALLMDMDGKVLHRWSCDFWAVWPDYPTYPGNENTQYWRRAYLYENGDILAIFEGLGLVKLDKNSKVLWEHPGKAHHDLEVAPNGDIYVLTRETRLLQGTHRTRPILEDFVSILGPDGVEKKRVSLLRCFENSEYKFWKRVLGWRRGDIFHTNTLELLDGRIADKVPAFRKGNVLISVLMLGAIAVADLEQEKIVWSHRGEFRSQHDPKILENGNLLLFDNKGRVGESSVWEIDPATKEVLWRYQGSKEAPFFSRTCGAAQRLPNGNTLVTESDPGRAFELTPDKQIVWEFINPNRAGDHGEYIATLFEMLRLALDFPLDWLSQTP